MGPTTMDEESILGDQRSLDERSKATVSEFTTIAASEPATEGELGEKQPKSRPISPSSAEEYELDVIR